MLLDDIIANKQQELKIVKDNFKRIKLQNLAQAFPPLRDFKNAISSPGLNLIAEIKKSSPSAGVIIDPFDPVALAKTYEGSGAAAISILTDSKYFQGSLSHVKNCKSSTGLPILRKDFIIDELQIVESRLAGADAVLLIVRILSDEQLSAFIVKAKELDLAAVVEVHSEAEANRALSAGADIIGINNRDLDTLMLDLSLTEKLAPKLSKKAVLVSESGISAKDQIGKLRELGVNAALIGESLLKSKDIPAKIKELFD